MARENQKQGKNFHANFQTEESFESLLDSYLPVKSPAAGKKIRGLVVSRNEKGFWVAYGGKGEAFAPANSFGNNKLEIGIKALFQVHGSSDHENLLTLSLEGGEPWEELYASKEQNQTLKVKVERLINRQSRLTALLVRYKKLRGIIPMSLLGLAAARASSLCGEEISVKVETVDFENERLIFNHKRIVEAERQAAEELRKNFIAGLNEGELLANLKIADIAVSKEGREYGLFVELAPGINGLIHKNEIPKEKCKESLSASFKKGELIDAVLLPLRQGKTRMEISLSIKALQTLKRKSFFAERKTGDIICGKLERRVKYGIFASVSEDAGLDGLIHLKQFPEGVEPELGAMVKLKIIHMNPLDFTLGLSMKGLNQ